jgi:hypothetical protein
MKLEALVVAFESALARRAICVARGSVRGRGDDELWAPRENAG